MRAPDLEDIEIELLLEGVYRYFGNDFRGYERAPVRHKLRQLMRELGVATISALQERVMHEPAAGAALLRRLSAQPSSMFADAARISALREVLVPWLRSCPVPNVWIAESCAAEDVFGLAILLEEEGLYARTQIFATSANEALLAEMREGSIDLDRFDAYERGYRLSGGKRVLSRYGELDGDRFVFSSELGRNVIWAQYNLSTDTSFNEFQLIICRRALADFGRLLRRRVLRLFDDSLSPFGILYLGGGDVLDASAATSFRAVPSQPGLYRRSV